MADVKKTLEILINAKDEASQTLKRVNSTLGDVGEAMKKAQLASAAFAVALGVGAKSVINASSEYQKSMIGLSTVAKAFNIDSESAKNAAQSLADDGLMSVKEAADGLKNLLATGFSLPEAINLMNGFKDSAAFNRQGMLGFGESIVGATQGLKNQNSIMVDNAGITKNLSIILKEAGLSVGDLGLITSDASVRQGLYNGILKETAIFSGDAKRSTETYQGKVAELETAVFKLKVKIGDELLPIVTRLIEEGLLPLIEKTGKAVDFMKQHKEIVIVLAGMIVGALIPAVWGAVAAFAALLVTLAPFIIAGGVFALIYVFLDKISKKTTGFSLLEQLSAAFELLRMYVLEPVIKAMQKAIDLIDKFIKKKNEADKKGSSGGGGNSWQHGGFIDAPFGQPVPAVLHGGERVIPRTGTDVNAGDVGSGGGVTLNLNFTGPVSMDSKDRVQDLADSVIRILGRQNELAGKGLAI